MGTLRFRCCQQRTKKGLPAVDQARVFDAKNQEMSKFFQRGSSSTFSSRESDWDVLLQPTTGHLVSTRQFLPSQGPSQGPSLSVIVEG
jgi:hypothetical protein